MKNFRYYFTAIATFIAVVSAEGQNSNFSQYHLTPVYTSPAESGMSDYVQVMTHYRKQSLVSDQGYKNFSIAGIYPLQYKDGRRFGGISLGIMNETSGAMGIFKETSVKAGYGYSLSVSTRQHVSVGLQGGYYRTGLSIGDIRTDTQYQNGTYDPGYSAGETFSDNTSQAFKLDAGVTWYGTDDSGRRLFSLGIGASNVNGARYDFIAGEMEDRLPVRYQVYGSWRVWSHDRLDIVPTFRYLSETNYSQLNVGSLFMYQLDASAASADESHLGMGLWYSLDNVAVVSVEWVQPSYVVSLSYDIPASSSVDYRQVNNSVEVTLGWRMKKGNN